MATIHPHNDISSIHDLFPKSLLKPIYRENLNIPPGYMGSKIPRGIGKSRMILSVLTGQDCFDLEPGHIPEITISQVVLVKQILYLWLYWITNTSYRKPLTAMLLMRL